MPCREDYYEPATETVYEVWSREWGTSGAWFCQWTQNTLQEAQNIVAEERENGLCVRIWEVTREEVPQRPQSGKFELWALISAYAQWQRVDEIPPPYCLDEEFRLLGLTKPRWFKIKRKRMTLK